MSSKFSIKEFFSFLFSIEFLKHVGLIIVFFVIIIISLLWWLNQYTHHGQKLTLPDYREMHVEKAMVDAEKRQFKIIIDDSTHIVGKQGGIIINQNPKPNSKVKENRKIYVGITKYQPDKIKIKDLPSLYGRSYDSKKRELALHKIKSKIKEYKYDKGEPNNILAAYYKGEIIISKDTIAKDIEIEKGGTIEFVLSRRSGGSTNLPNLRCQTVEQATFLIESRNLKLGIVRKNGNIESEPTGFVIRQIPSPIEELPMGSVIDLMISDELPDDCK